MSQNTNELFAKLAKENDVKFEVVDKLIVTKKYKKQPTLYIPNNEIQLKQ